MLHAFSNLKRVPRYEVAPIDDFFVGLDIAVIHICIDYIDLTRRLDPEGSRRWQATVHFKSNGVESFLTREQVGL